MSDSRITNRQRGNVVVLDLQAQYLAGPGDVCRIVSDLCQQGHRLFLLNMTAVRFIYGDGLEDIQRAAYLVKQHGGYLGLAGLSERSLWLVEHSTAIFSFEVFETEDAGVQALEDPEVSPRVRIFPRGRSRSGW